MNTWTIYKITSPSNKIYVGQTKNFKSRINNYKNGHCKKQVKLFNSIKKYGFEEHHYEILEENITSLILSNEREIYWIKFYDSNNSGLNCSKGGTGKVPLLKEEVKEKIRLATQKRWDSGEMKGMTGKKLSEDHKKAILLSNIGSKRSSETIEKLKFAKANRTLEQNENWLVSMNLRTGYKQTDETKLKIKLTRKEKINNGEIIIKTKTILCLNNNVIYQSAKEAAENLQLPNIASINNVCNGTRNSVYGYKFIYTNET